MRCSSCSVLLHRCVAGGRARGAAAAQCCSTAVLQEVEREVQLQISLKQEMEVAVRLLEKDIHEKQDSIVSLRKQLDDIKAINIELYSKQQVSQLPLK